MGIIRKQSIYSSIFTYIGFAIGALNLLVLLTPKFGFFTLDESGLTRLFLDFGNLFAVIAAMGSLTTFIKFYPFHHTYLKKEQNDLPFIVILVCTAGAVLLTICIFVFEDFFARKFSRNSALFIQHFRLVIPLTISMIFFNLFEAFAWMLQKTVVSNFVKEVLLRVFALITIVIFYLGWISIDTFFILYTLIYFPAAAYLAYVVFKDGRIKIQTRISSVTRKLYSKMLTFTVYHFTGGVFQILPRTMDLLMIASVVEGGLGKALIYSIPTYLVTVMEVPQRSMMGIGSSTISESWKRNDVKNIRTIYRKSSINLLAAGLFIFGLIFPNLDNLVRFMGEEFMPVKLLFLILGIGKLLDLMMGLNNLILGFSKYWKTDFYTNIIFIIFSVGITYLLTKKFGMTGTALGSALTMFGYNLLRFIFIYRFLKMQPFTPKTLIVLALGIAALLITCNIPYAGNLYMDTFIRSITFLILFALGLIYFNISPDINELYRMSMSKIFKRNQ